MTFSCDAAPEILPKNIRPSFGGHPEKHLILLHGWNAGSASLDSLKLALRALPPSQEWNLWSVDYPTHRWNFRRGAREIAQSLRATNHDFSDTIFLGYSMGGVVARQIVADGFPFRALVSVAAPHQGLARWVPTHSPGTASIHRRSRLLKELNQSAADKAARFRYHFFSITYSDMVGFHAHDGLVTRSSALGDSLGEVASRENLDFVQRGFALHEPHMRGMSARDMNAVIHTCARLMQPKSTPE